MNIKKLIMSGAAVLGLCAAFAAGASAEEDVVTVLVDNVNVQFDQQPVILDGHTLVPARAVFEQAGATVTWDQPSQTATIAKDQYTVTIKYGDTALYRNGERIEIEMPAVMIEDRIMLPVRAISEAMDFAVTWDGHHSMVLVSTDGKPYRAYAFLKTGFKTLEDAAEFYTNGTAYETGVDLDNDGVPETIEFASSLDMTSVTSPVLTIDGIDYTAGLGDLTSAYSLAVVDIDRNDSTKELIVSENGDTLTAHFYRYENGILKVLAEDNVPSEISYASKLLLSGTGYIISDLSGTCFVDIMVTGGVYKLEEQSVALYRMRSIESIYGRNLYRVYDDNMLYHVIYTNSYTAGSYKDVTDTGVIGATDLQQFKIIDGYVDTEDPTYIELYIELTDGSKAVIKPYQT